MTISNRYSQPHTEINEDGYQLQHPGYITLHCIRCGQEILQSANYTPKIELCHKCQRK